MYYIDYFIHYSNRCSAAVEVSSHLLNSALRAWHNKKRLYGGTSSAKRAALSHFSYRGLRQCFAAPTNSRPSNPLLPVACNSEDQPNTFKLYNMHTYSVLQRKEAAKPCAFIQTTYSISINSLIKSFRVPETLGPQSFLGFPAAAHISHIFLQWKSKNKEKQKQKQKQTQEATCNATVAWRDAAYKPHPSGGVRFLKHRRFRRVGVQRKTCPFASAVEYVIPSTALLESFRTWTELAPLTAS